MQYWEDFSIDERKICASGNFSQQTMSIVTEWDSVQINRTVDKCNWGWTNHFEYHIYDTFLDTLKQIVESIEV